MIGMSWWNFVETYKDLESYEKWNHRFLAMVNLNLIQLDTRNGHQSRDYLLSTMFKFHQEILIISAATPFKTWRSNAGIHRILYIYIFRYFFVGARFYYSPLLISDSAPDCVLPDCHQQVGSMGRKLRLRRICYQMSLSKESLRVRPVLSAEYRTSKEVD